MNLLFNVCAVVLIGIAEMTAAGAALAAGPVAASTGSPTLPPGQAARRSGYALLVGCTRYDNRPQLRPLVGPANDVELMRHVLEDAYRFDPSHIVILSEASAEKGGERYRPVRKAIEREFNELIRKAKRNDEIVILLSGHGSQQPDDPDPQKADELDGLDEIFLPADIGPAGEDGLIPNAVIDDELGAWTSKIAATGAHVFLIADCCHAGTMLRGDVEISREIPAEVLGSEKALEAARDRARRNPPTKRGEGQTLIDGGGEGVVALYAAKADETAPERPMPYGDPGGQNYGVLTFTLCKLMLDQIAEQNAVPLTYRELGQRIQAQYVAWGRLNGPTPFVDAATGDIDREVLGSRLHIGRSRIMLAGDAAHGWTINVGRVHGVTKDSILAVYPLVPSRQSQKTLGYVVVTESRVFEASVAPVQYDDTPPPASLPERALCALVKLDLGELRIPVAIDTGERGKGRTGKGSGAEATLSKPQLARLRELEAGLKARAKEPAALFQIVPTLAGASWALHYRGNDLLLLPVDAAQVPANRPLRGGTPLFPIIPEQTAEHLAESLGQIARAQNLIAIAKNARRDSAIVSEGLDNQSGTRPAESSAGDSPRIRVELLKCKGRDDKTGQVIPLGGKELQLHRGDWIAFRVTNAGPRAVDFTLLFIDSKFGITPLFPTRWGDENRLASSESPQSRPYQTRAFRVNDKTVGHEYLVAIAVAGGAQSEHADFTFLAQADVDSRPRSGGANGSRSVNSALGRLLRQAMYRDGGKRGLDSDEVGQHDAELLSWDVVK